MTISLEQLSAYHDDEIADRERAEVDVHIAGCSACQAALHRWRDASRALATRGPVTLRRRRPAVVIAIIAALLLLTSGVAVATGLFSEVYRIGNVLAAASRPVSLAEARITGLPLPASDRLPGGWSLREQGVQLTRTAEWSSVALQYDRDGQRGLNVTTWSPGMRVFDPSRPDQYDEIITVSGVPVHLSYRRDPMTSQPSAQAFFVLRGATVEIHAFGPAIAGREFGSKEVAALVEAWMEEAR
ncbi:MAG: zf-HC2 domain-containing protein [Candidatus Limnocylindria bacterium]